MIQKDPAARIPCLSREERSEAAQHVIDIFSLSSNLDVDDNHVLNTFAHHPALAEPFLNYNYYLLRSSTLPARLRQIAIMRVAWLRKSRYVWSSHLRTSLRAGLEAQDFEPIKDGPHAAYWNDQEKAVLHATDELVTTSNIENDSWQALSETLDRQQLLDFLFTVGTYLQISLVTNAIRIEREDDLLQLAERFGAPE